MSTPQITVFTRTKYILISIDTPIKITTRDGKILKNISLSVWHNSIARDYMQHTDKTFDHIIDVKPNTRHTTARTYDGPKSPVGATLPWDSNTQYR